MGGYSEWSKKDILNKMFELTKDWSYCSSLDSLSLEELVIVLENELGGACDD